MAVSENLRTITLEAPSTAFSTRQYHMVIQSSSENVFAVGSTVANKTAVGVLQGAPTVSGEAVSIAIAGSVTKMRIGSTTLAPGKNFKMGPLGVAVTTANATAGDIVYGPWMSPAATTVSVGFGLFQPLFATT